MVEAGGGGGGGGGEAGGAGSRRRRWDGGWLVAEVEAEVEAAEAWPRQGKLPGCPGGPVVVVVVVVVVVGATTGRGRERERTGGLGAGTGNGRVGSRMVMVGTAASSVTLYRQRRWVPRRLARQSRCRPRQ